MPHYDYVCAACGHEVEIFQSITESPKRKCPKCGKLKLERMIGTGAGVIFKGSGFYETDYRSKSYEDGAKVEQEKSKEKPSEKPSEKKDTKSAPSKDKKSAAKKPKKQD